MECFCSCFENNESDSRKVFETFEELICLFEFEIKFEELFLEEIEFRALFKIRFPCEIDAFNFPIFDNIVFVSLFLELKTQKESFSKLNKKNSQSRSKSEKLILKHRRNVLRFISCKVFNKLLGCTISSNRHKSKCSNSCIKNLSS